MKDDLKNIWHLQILDDKIAELEKRKDAIPREIQNEEAEVKKSETAILEKKKEIEKEVERRREIERKTDETTAKIKQYKGQLLSVKTNREYKALLVEIETGESKIASYEDSNLGILSKTDELNKQLRKMRSGSEEKRKEFEKNRGILESEQSDVTNKLNVKEDERKRLVSRIDNYLVTKYERIRAKRDEMGVSAITRPLCTGCNNVIPPQFTVEIRKGDKVMCCEHCGRILVWKENVT